MKVFLTGGTGFIGQPLASALRSRGWSVDALVRDPDADQAVALAGMGCTLVRGDVTETDGLAAMMSDADVVIHNAGVYELGGTKSAVERMRSVNVAGTRHVLDAAKSSGVAKTIYVSSAVAIDPALHEPAETRPPGAVFRDPRTCTPYNRSKAEAHAVALEFRQAGLPLVNVMPNAVVGPNDHSVFGYLQRSHLVKRGLPLSVGKDSRISPVHVDSLVEGICLVVEHAPAGEDYVFSGESQSMAEVWGEFARQPGGMKVRVFMPRWFMRPQMILFEALLRTAGLPAFLSRDLVDQTRGDYDYSSSKAERDLGWSCPPAAEMWDQIFADEQKLLAQRDGVRNKLRPVAVPASG